MTLIELLFFVFNLCLGILLGALIGRNFGVVWGILAVPVGFCVGILLFKALIILGDLYYVLWRPLRPPCRRGVCKAKDYELIEATREGSFYRCQCGDKYLMGDRRFYLVMADGSTKPYMAYKPFRRWKEEGKPES